MIHQANKITALLTAFFLFVTQFGPVSEGFAYTPTAAVSEVDIPSSFQVTLPHDFGTIESLLAGSGPAILHIQEAHGSPRVQKRIESIIHYLVSEYGVKLILLEGSASKLDPNLARFFPENMDLTVKILESLRDKSIATGPELFLAKAKDDDVEAYGIENLDAYVQNGHSFKEVLTQKEKSKAFVSDLDLEIKHLTSPYMNKSLREFIESIEDYEEGLTSFKTWLSTLKDKASEHLDLDLTSPIHQMDWPMLLRVFTLEAFESKLDLKALEEERTKFLSAIRPYLSARHPEAASQSNAEGSHRVRAQRSF